MVFDLGRLFHSEPHKPPVTSAALDHMAFLSDCQALREDSQVVQRRLLREAYVVESEREAKRTELTGAHR